MTEQANFLRRARMALHDMVGRVETGKLEMFARTIEYAEEQQKRAEDAEAELAGGSFYKERDIDAMQDEIAALKAERDKLRGALGQLYKTVNSIIEKRGIIVTSADDCNRLGRALERTRAALTDSQDGFTGGQAMTDETLNPEAIREDMKVSSCEPWRAEQPHFANGWWVVFTDPDTDGTIDASGDGGFDETTARRIARLPDLERGYLDMRARTEAAEAAIRQAVLLMHRDSWGADYGDSTERRDALAACLACLPEGIAALADAQEGET